VEKEGLFDLKMIRVYQQAWVDNDVVNASKKRVKHMPDIRIHRESHMISDRESTLQ